MPATVPCFHPFGLKTFLVQKCQDVIDHFRVLIMVLHPLCHPDFYTIHNFKVQEPLQCCHLFLSGNVQYIVITLTQLPYIHTKKMHSQRVQFYQLTTLISCWFQLRPKHALNSPGLSTNCSASTGRCPKFIGINFTRNGNQNYNRTVIHSSSTKSRRSRDK